MTPNISNWKFCKVKKGTKIPYPGGWQKQPLALNQIPVGDNYGLLTGVHTGILAIDFDGKYGIDWYKNNINISLPDTITWTSNKDYRLQYAYSVPKELWKHIKTISFSNGLDKPDLEAIQFRWNGLQSVLPPSIHPDTGKPYEWIGIDEVAECPIEILEFLVENNGKKTVSKAATAALTLVRPVITGNSLKLAELNAVLTAYKKHYPALVYDKWRDVTWACITHVGINAGMASMMVFYPEQDGGEYDKLAATYVSSCAPSLGSLIFAIQQRDPNFNMLPKYKDEALVKSVIAKRLKKDDKEEFNMDKNKCL